MKKRTFAKNIRLKNHNYSQNGYYFVTLCTTKGQNLIPNYKQILEAELLDLPNRFLGLNIDERTFMDNHCHIILRLNSAPVSLSRIIQAYKSLTTLKTKQSGYQEKRFWQPNYYEHVIRSEDELRKVKLYIRANPYKEKIDWTRLDDYLV